MLHVEGSRDQQGKHTPGPWYPMGLSGHYQGPEGEFIHIQSRTESTTCFVGKAYVLNSNETARGIAQANAHLIAAAPDMLAALRAIVFQTCQGSVLDRDACISQARAAIAKAEGRAS